MNRRPVAAALLCAAACHIAGANAAPALDSRFDLTPFEPLDFTAHCQALYGADAVPVYPVAQVDAVACDLDGTEYAAFPQSACEEQYAAGYRAVRIGLQPGDWRCTDWQAADAQVVPVILVASDITDNIPDFNQAFLNSASLMEGTQDWYAANMPAGRTFRMTHPVVVISSFTASELNDISCGSYPLESRSAQCNPALPATTVREFGLFYTAVDEVKDPLFSNSADALIAAPIFVYTGLDATTIHLGAAAWPTTPTAQSGVWLNVQPPKFPTCPVGDMECGLWPLAHELGHSFGLAHSCDADAFPNDACWMSVMQNSNIAEMVLLAGEQNLLVGSRFFPPNSTGANGSCTYTLESVWQSGFQAKIRIENPSAQAINGWQVSWSYQGVSRVNNSWEATVTGSNPYSASNLSWNGSIAAGGAVEFRIYGTTVGGESEQPVVSGAVCGN